MKRVKILLIIVSIMFLVTCIFSGVAFAGREEVEEAEEPIKIGIPVPITGSMAADGTEMVKGAELAVEEINATGGINGRPVEMITFDTKELLAETFQAGVEKLILKDDVVVNVSGYAGEAGPDTFGKYDVPYIYHEPSNYCRELQQQYPHVFMNGDHTLSQGEVLFAAIVNFAKAGGFKFPNKEFAVVMGQWTAIQEQALGMTEQAKALGWEQVMEQVAPEGTREWSGTMSKLRSLKPSIIIFNMWDYPAIQLFKKEFEKYPWDCLIYLGEGPSIPEYREGLTRSQDGELGMGVIGPMPNEKGDALKRAYKAKYGTEMPERPVVPSYDGVWIWANAARQVDDVRDFEAVSNAIQNSVWEGAGGTYIFESDRHVDKANVPAHVYQVQNGKLVLIALNDEVVAGAKFAMPAWIK